MRTIVHLSDLHFGALDPRLVDPLVAAVTSIAPHLVAVSGDLTQRARHAQFKAARQFLERLPSPRLVVPGNHDVPLFDIAERLTSPLGRYARYITPDFAPEFADDELVVVGLNSARAMLWRSGGGRINERQVAAAVARLAAAPASVMRVVVTHHPFDLPSGHDARHLIGRANLVMPALASARVDLFLAGHLHVSHVGHTVERYRIAGHSALVVQAGTISVRGRGELNSFNVLRLDSATADLERWTWGDTDQQFHGSGVGRFERTSTGWVTRR
jgi:3',5'-cyclic AMP phosphodiesterase CpdA